MARSIEELLVKIDASTEGLRRELKRGDQAVEQSNRNMGRSLDGIGKKFQGLQRAAGAFIGAYAVAMAGRGIKTTLMMADGIDVLQDRIKSATKETGDYKRVWDGLNKTAGETGGSLEGSVDLFQRLSFGAKDLGKSNAEIIKLNDTVQKLGIISGSSMSAMTNGTLQFAQGIGAGIFRAEEFNSVLENMPALADAIARGMGMTVAQLRAAVKSGNLLSKDVFEAVLSQSARVNKEVAEMPSRLGRAGSKLMLAFGARIDEINEKLGLTNSLAKGLEKISNSIRPETIDDYEARVVRLQGLLGKKDKLKLSDHTVAAYEAEIQRLNILVANKKGVVFPLIQPEDEKEASSFRVVPERKPYDHLTPMFDDDVTDMRGGRQNELAEAARENAEKIKEMYGDLEMAVLRSTGQQREIIQKGAEQELQIWEELFEAKKVTETQFSEARRMIAEKTANEIKKITDKELEEAQRKAEEFGNALSASFESRGIDALLNGDLGGALKGLAKDFAEIALRLLVLKPLAESLFGSIGSGGGGGGFFGNIIGGIGSILGGGRAGGGPVRGGMVYNVGERGPEKLVIPANGSIVPNHKIGEAANQNNTSVNVTQHITLSPDVSPTIAAQIQQAAPMIKSEAIAGVMQVLQGVRV